MRKEAAVVAAGVAISAVIVLGSILRPPAPPPPQKIPQESPPPPPHAPWVEFYEERTGYEIPWHIKTLLWIAVHRNDDGSCGNSPARLDGRPLGRTGQTALALLPFLGAGYANYSKDVFPYEGGDWHIGAEIGKSLAWLLRDQREDGTFRSSAAGSFDQVLAAFVLSDNYGITLQEAFKPPAQRAVDALLKMQKPDGTWEAAETTAWAIIALRCAQVSELGVDTSAIDRALLASRSPGHPGGALARVLLKTDAKEAIREITQESRDWEISDPAWWYLATLSVWCHDGTRGKEWYEYKPGPTWEAWSPAVRERLLSLFQRDGSVAGSSPEDAMVRTCLSQLTLEVYYRYANVFTPH